MGKTSRFLALNVDISKTFKEVVHGLSIDTEVDDLELL